MSAHRNGHFASAFKMKAVSRTGEPLPWYTYPSIDFLKYRSYRNKRILEFGGGQSSLWWASRAASVVTFEGDLDWYNKIKQAMPPNVGLYHVSTETAEVNVGQVNATLASLPHTSYDVVIIDGLHRYEMIQIASRMLSEDGIIVCDNSDGYGIYEGFKNRGLKRVDFYGNAPGVILPHCTSVYFKPDSFVFDPSVPIHVVATD